MKLVNRIFVSAIFVLLFSNQSSGEGLEVNVKTGSQSPTFICVKDSCKQVVRLESVSERVGKKVAIRGLYLLPTYGFAEHTCPESEKGCSDSYETAFIYVAIQSIWPEPILLTSSKIEIKGTNKIEMISEMQGHNILSDQITKIDRPTDFVIRPGEIKYFFLSQGMKLNGVLNFFNGDILKEYRWDDLKPRRIPNGQVVLEFNKFMKQVYGANSYIRIALYEKDYRELIATNAKIGNGGDIFSNGDERLSKYQFQYDAFIGEALYQLNGGKAVFQGITE